MLTGVTKQITQYPSLRLYLIFNMETVYAEIQRNA